MNWEATLRVPLAPEGPQKTKVKEGLPEQGVTLTLGRYCMGPMGPLVANRGPNGAPRGLPLCPLVGTVHAAFGPMRLIVGSAARRSFFPFGK